jgi:hypothetical protein
MTAERAGGATRRDEGLAASDERRGLLTSDDQSADGAALVVGGRLFNGGLLRDQHHPVGLAVVGELHGTDRPFGLDRLFQVEVGWKHPRGGQVGEQLTEELAERRELLLLQLQADQPMLVAGLEVEGPVAWRADRADREM